MTWATIKNWAEFQHYKDRSPPWLKLHRKLLDDRTFQSLPLASKALAPMLWLLAAENMEGRVNIDPAELEWRLRWKLSDINAGLKPLIDRGFLILDSKPLAARSQAATPEAETEEADKEANTLSGKPLDGFEAFWSAYPNKKGKAEASKTWGRKKLSPHLQSILRDIATRQKSDPDWKRGAIPHGSTYVQQERWQDAIAPDAAGSTGNTAGPSPRKSRDEEKAQEAEALALMRAQHRELGIGTH